MANNRKKIEPGFRFQKMTVITEIEPYINPSSNQKVRRFECKCDCGKIKNITIGNMSKTKSCGCENLKKIIETCKTHGLVDSPEYNSWRAMKSRCLNPKHIAYKNYGGRGIKICDEWIDSFNNFLRDMGNRPSLNHTLDRKNNNGNYDPTNCRWATPKQQAKNRRK